MQKGIVKCSLICHGLACHSGYPHVGISAIDTLLRVLGEVQSTKWPSHPLLGETTLNIGLIEGGHATNALASHATSQLMFRIISEPHTILDRLSSICSYINL